eukprot:scaffold21075_cov23-Tisochrysis_lutea.AAC.1
MHRGLHEIGQTMFQPFQPSSKQHYNSVVVPSWQTTPSASRKDKDNYPEVLGSESLWVSLSSKDGKRTPLNPNFPLFVYTCFHPVPAPSYPERLQPH